MKSSGIVLDVDETAIGSGIDKSRYHHTLTATDTIPVRGHAGKGTLFNGTTSFVDCGNDASLNITDAITIEAWVKSTSSGAWGFIVGKEYSEENYQLIWDGTDAMHFRITQNEVIIEKAGNTTGLSIDTWYYFACTFDRVNMRLYLNGVPDGIRNSPGSIDSDLAEPVIIGCRYSGGSHFNGTISSVRIYNRALSSTEIRRSYLSKAYLYQPHPVRIP